MLQMRRVQYGLRLVRDIIRGELPGASWRHSLLAVSQVPVLLFSLSLVSSVNLFPIFGTVYVWPVLFIFVSVAGLHCLCVGEVNKIPKNVFVDLSALWSLEPSASLSTDTSKK